MNLNLREKESGLLLSAIKLIRSVVNRSMLSLSVDLSSVCIRPQSLEASELFNVLLVDFISPLGKPFPPNLTMLEGIAEVCKNPQFEIGGSVGPLRRAVPEMESWLTYNATFEKVWLPSIERELTLTMQRKEFIYHCGNIAKHNMFRLDVVARKLLHIFQRSDPSITLEDAYLAMDDYFQWFHRDIFLYHLTKICELLNNIGWGIHHYLLPEYHRSYTVDHEKSSLAHIEAYCFDVPPEIQSEAGRALYWDLMNEVRAKPYILPFRTEHYLTGRY